MADTGERDVRDRLAEALYCGGYAHGGWEFAPAHMVMSYRHMADRVLSALPTVGLRIGRVEE